MLCRIRYESSSQHHSGIAARTGKDFCAKSLHAPNRQPTRSRMIPSRPERPRWSTRIKSPRCHYYRRKNTNHVKPSPIEPSPPSSLLLPPRKTWKLHQARNKPILLDRKRKKDYTTGFFLSFAQDAALLRGSARQCPDAERPPGCVPRHVVPCAVQPDPSQHREALGGNASPGAGRPVDGPA